MQHMQQVIPEDLFLYVLCCKMCSWYKQDIWLAEIQKTNIYRHVSVLPGFCQKMCEFVRMYLSNEFHYTLNYLRSSLCICISKRLHLSAPRTLKTLNLKVRNSHADIWRPWTHGCQGKIKQDRKLFLALLYFVWKKILVTSPAFMVCSLLNDKSK